MVLFEIWSVGKKPFSKFSNSEVVRQINTGYNQPPPPGCPRAIYQLMVDCWYVCHINRHIIMITVIASILQMIILNLTGILSTHNAPHSQALSTT